MNDQTDSQLLRAYAEHRSEPAFAELVRRHVDLVYSAALRMVCDSHLAQDVTQGVFVALAKNASQLTERSVLSGWLHRTAQNIAAQTVRTDVRRRAREQEAAAMNELLSAEPDVVWEHIAPHLDAALGELSEPDRDALLLRYFERKSAREMAQTLGINEDAAQKRVSRAVERLREFFAKRGVTVGASGLLVVISANAVQAAPAGLASTISTVAALAGTTIAATTTATITKSIAMTTLQKTLITATLAAAVGTGIYEARQASQLRDQVQTLKQQQTPLAEQIRQLQRERDDATNRLASLRDDNERLNRNTAELLKLRGEAARLRDDSQTALQAVRRDNRIAPSAQAWLDRVRLLKERLDQTPEANIPELKYLTEEEWIGPASRQLDSEADYRLALTGLRLIAKVKFGNLLSKAVKAYSKANAGDFPSDVLELKPYFESLVEETTLRRYEVVSAKDYPDEHLGGDWIITQKTPLEGQWDIRVGVGSQGMTTNLPIH